MDRWYIAFIAMCFFALVVVIDRYAIKPMLVQQSGYFPPSEYPQSASRIMALLDDDAGWYAGRYVLSHREKKILLWDTVVGGVQVICDGLDYTDSYSQEHLDQIGKKFHEVRARVFEKQMTQARDEAAARVLEEVLK